MTISFSKGGQGLNWAVETRREISVSRRTHFHGTEYFL